MTQDEFIDKWLVGYESREQKEEFAIEMMADLASLQSKGKTSAEEFLRDKYKLVDFHDLTLNGKPWVELMEEYAQSHAKPNHLGKTKEQVWEAVQSYHQIEGTIPEGSRVEAAVYDAMERFANQDGWIPVTERLPENGQEVIAFLKKTETNWLQHSVIVKAHVLDSRATHWMPLPKPPQP